MSFLVMGLLVQSLPRSHAAAEPTSEVRLDTQYARVTGHSGGREVIGRVAAAIDEAAPRIASVVGTRDLRPMAAFVHLHRNDFREATGIPAESAVVGLASVPGDVIHIDGTGVRASVRKVVTHEVGHIMIGRALGPALPALPAWANEGIAEYVAGKRAAQVDPFAVRAIGRGMALDLDELDSAIAARGTAAGIAYAQSASLVNFLVERRGDSVIASLLAAVRRSGDFDTALQEVAGISSPELESAWRKSISRRWGWPLLLQSPTPILGLMLLLFLIGVVRFYVAKRRRRERLDYDW
jgi:hypothetical protein